MRKTTLLTAPGPDISQSHPPAGCLAHKPESVIIGFRAGGVNLAYYPWETFGFRDVGFWLGVQAMSHMALGIQGLDGASGSGLELHSHGICAA